MLSLLVLYIFSTESQKWISLWHTFLPITVLYLVSNIFFAFAPFISLNGSGDPDVYPYFVFPIVGVVVLLLGAVYWYLWTTLWPKLGGYRMVTEHMFSEMTGYETVRYRKTKNTADKSL